MCRFLKDVVEFEPYNKMTAYNVSITVSPNIFRPKTEDPNELYVVSTLYDAMIRIIDNYSLVFEP